MPFQSVPNTAQATVRFTLLEREFSNTFHYEADAGYTESDLQDLADAVDSVVGTYLLPLLDVRVTYLRTDVRGLDAENDLFVTANAETGVGGQGLNRALPNNVAFVLSRRSGLTGRSARGRVFIGGLPAISTFFEVPHYTMLNTTAAESFRTAVDEFRKLTTGLPAWQPVIVSRFTNGSKRATGVTFNWVYTTYEDRIVDTRRSRLR
jgi:hypothetical protein